MHPAQKRTGIPGSIPILITFLLCTIQTSSALWTTNVSSDTVSNLIVNGSFEIGPDPGLYLPLQPGDTVISGWTVTRGQIDYVGVWQAYEGTRSIDLDGGPGFGGIEQSFSTTPGQNYKVRFAMAGNSHGPPQPKEMEVTAAGQSALFTFDATFTTYDSMQWQMNEWIFTATSALTTLEFFSRDTVDGFYGPALDSVTVLPFGNSVESTILAYWQFDEDSGSVLHDSSPYHNDGIIYNATWVPGITGSALHFNGITSYVRVPNTLSLRPSTDFKIEAWFSLDTLQFDYAPPPDEGHGVILSNLGPYPHGGGYQFHLQSGAKFQFAYRVGDPISDFTGKTDIPISRQFYHVAVTYQTQLVGTTELYVVKTYLDTILTDSSVFSHPVHYNNTPYFYIGTNIDGRAAGSFGIRDFPGIIDEIKITKLDPLPPLPPDSTVHFTIPLTISDNGTSSEILHFGVHPDATSCLDTGLGEWESPPIPPISTFDARFTLPACFGLPLALDLRPYTSPSQVDTYHVSVQAGYYGYPITFSWPDLNLYYSDSVKLIDYASGGFVNVNMKTQTSFTLTNSTVRELLIIAKHPRSNPSLHVDNEVMPMDYALSQNYPNPFNPETHLQFSIAKLQFVSLKVYDVLGREVATLVNEQKPPGSYTISWDASNIPSGVYFYKITSGIFSETKKMILIR